MNPTTAQPLTPVATADQIWIRFSSFGLGIRSNHAHRDLSNCLPRLAIISMLTPYRSPATPANEGENFQAVEGLDAIALSWAHVMPIAFSRLAGFEDSGSPLLTENYPKHKRIGYCFHHVKPSTRRQTADAE